MLASVAPVKKRGIINDYLPPTLKNYFQQTAKCHKALCQIVQQQVLVVEIIHFLD
jgi:hypothetical protein